VKINNCFGKAAKYLMISMKKTLITDTFLKHCQILHLQDAKPKQHVAFPSSMASVLFCKLFRENSLFSKHYGDNFCLKLALDLFNG